jgi:prevent-host-death family protein
MTLPKLVNISSARARLSELVQRAARGEEITIARHGEPLARLVPLAPTRPRVPGHGEGEWHVVGDFNKPLPDEVLAAFAGRKA